MDKCDISLIIPVYKSERFLRQCLDSVMAQSFTDFELVLVDDGSPDGSGAICDEYAAQDARVRVIHKSNAGVSAARNSGIDAAIGEYVMFMDSDDTVDGDFLEKAYGHVRAHDADLYISGITEEYYEGGSIVKTVTYGIRSDGVFDVRGLFGGLFTDYPQICICGPCCKLYKRSILEAGKVRFDESMCRGEDTDFNISYLKHTNKIYFDKGCYYHYRRDGDQSLFSSFNKDTLEIHKHVYGRMGELIAAVGCDEGTVLRFRKACVGMWLGCITHYFLFAEKNDKRARRDMIRKVAEEELIRTFPLRHARDKKQMLLLLLMRLHAYGAVYTIFEKKFVK